MKMYGIYLSKELTEGDEKWFNTTFSSPSRAKWFAEGEGLESHEYEIRYSHDLGNKQKEVA
jgi:hypothetical protein